MQEPKVQVQLEIQVRQQAQVRPQGQAQVCGEVEQLVLCAKFGDSEAREQICRDFQPLVEAVARRYYGVSFEDACQEGYVALLQAIRFFDPLRGVPFAGFARMKVHGDVRSAMRREWTHTERTAHTRMEREGDEGAEGMTPEDKLALRTWRAHPDEQYESIEWRELLTHAGLTRREAYSIQEGAKGRSSTEIAKEMGVSPETVKTWRKRALRKIRKALER